jgi:hypothetical protein
VLVVATVFDANDPGLRPGTGPPLVQRFGFHAQGVAEENGLREFGSGVLATSWPEAVIMFTARGSKDANVPVSVGFDPPQMIACSARRQL